MTINLTKKELQLLNKVMGLFQDYEMEDGDSKDVSSTDEFNSLNEKLAEKLAES